MSAKVSTRKGPFHKCMAVQYRGNALIAGDSHRGWFIGGFMTGADEAPLRSGFMEVKWGRHPVGTVRHDWAGEAACTSVALLSSGRTTEIFRDQQCVLEREGDLATWGAGVDHRWAVDEDVVVLTLRWLPPVDATLPSGPPGPFTCNAGDIVSSSGSCWVIGADAAASALRSPDVDVAWCSSSAGTTSDGLFSTERKTVVLLLRGTITVDVDGELDALKLDTVGDMVVVAPGVRLKAAAVNDSVWLVIRWSRSV